MGIFDDISESIKNIFSDITTEYKKSNRWKEYKLGFTITHCALCYSRRNKIYDAYLDELPNLPEHEKCLCYLVDLRVLGVGQATKLGINGVDYYLSVNGTLPNYYISKEEAVSLGWVSWKGNLDKVAPGKMIGGNIFANREGKLPNKPSRIWYECDIDYNGGYRNNARIIYSNDGLIFKTDSHYESFIAIE